MFQDHANNQSVTIHRKNGRILDAFSAAASGRVSSAASRVLEVPGMRTTRFHFERDDANGYCEFISLEAGLYLVIMDFSLPKGFRTRLIGEDLVEFHYRLSGSISLNGQWGSVTANHPSMLLWHQPFGHDDVWEELGVGGSERELSVTLFVDAKWLRLMYGNEQSSSSRHLGTILGGNPQIPTHHVISPRPEVAGTLQSILRDQEDGALRLFNMKARGYDLLVSSLKSTSVETNPAMPFFTRREIEKIDEAKNILEREYCAPPAMPSLAKHLGLNTKKLGMGLKMRHSTTFQELVKDLRLARAYELLTTTDLQVGQIAFAVGYSHQSTFSKAFGEKFGILPKVLIRSRQEKPNIKKLPLA